MTSTASDVLVKLPDDQLRGMAMSRSTDRVSVIIEVDLPMPQLKVQRRALADGSGYRLAGIASQDEATHKNAEVQTGLAGKFLASLLGKEPLYLSTAEAFVAEVDGRELAEIASSPLFRSVRINRRLKP